MFKWLLNAISGGPSLRRQDKQPWTQMKRRASPTPSYFDSMQQRQKQTRARVRVVQQSPNPKPDLCGYKIAPFSLRFRIPEYVTGRKSVRSFSGHGIYQVSLAEQTCTCPDFKKRRAMQPRNHFSRWCKHLMREYIGRDVFEHASPFHKAFAFEAAGTHRKAVKLSCSELPDMVATIGLDEEWLNVFAQTRRKGERVHNASGGIRRFGWNFSQQRWSYGVGPPGAGKVRKLLTQINSFDELQALCSRRTKSS